MPFRQEWTGLARKSTFCDTANPMDYAEASRFTEAVQTAHKVLNLATQQHRQTLAESIKAKIPLYEAGTLFRAMPQPRAAGSIQR